MKITYVKVYGDKVAIKTGEVEKETNDFYITAKDVAGKTRHKKDLVKIELGVGIDVTNEREFAIQFLNKRAEAKKAEVEFYKSEYEEAKKLAEDFANGK